MRMGEILKGQLALILLVCLLTIALLPFAPLSGPGRDSGVFLYIGQQILEGRLPYLDVWDHKGPLLYLINALGVLIDPTWGVFVLQAVAVSGTLLWLLRVMSCHFGDLPSFVGIAMGIGLLCVSGEGGNYTETYTLPLQCIALVAVALAAKSKGFTRLRWHLVLGALFGAALLLRPNNVATLGVAALAVASIDLSRSENAWLTTALRALGTQAIGALLVIAPVLAWLVMQGAGAAFVESYLRYNFLYASELNTGNRLFSWLSLVRKTDSEPLLAMCLLGAIYAGLSVRARSFSRSYETVVITVVAALSAFGEMAASSLSAVAYPHYAITWIVPLSVLGTVGSFGLVTYLERSFDIGSKIRMARIVPLAAIAAVLVIGPVRSQFIPTLLGLRGGDSTPRSDLIAWGKNVAKDQDSLLMWGAETGVNFLTGVVAPSRYPYQYPILQCEYVSDEEIASFVNSIERARPVIVDTSASNLRIMPLERGDRSWWLTRYDRCGLEQRFARLLKLVEQTYIRAPHLDRLAPNKRGLWTVYLPRPAA